MNGVKQMKFLKHDISMLKELISDNDTSILRLVESKNNIINKQEYLIQSQKLNTQLELSSNTWAGRSADEFKEMKRSVQQEFKSILDLQIEVLIDNISMKISHLMELNKAYENKIHDKELELRFYQTEYNC